VADPLYTAQATAYHGRDGAVKSSDGILDLEVHPPTELGGRGSGTNPEQLFAAGYAACFGSSLLFFAARREIDISDSTVTALATAGRNAKAPRPNMAPNCFRVTRPSDSQRLISSCE